MIYDASVAEHRKFRLVDKNGVKIPLVKSFNTESCEAEVYLRNAEGGILVDSGAPAIAKIILKEAKIVRN